MSYSDSSLASLFWDDDIASDPALRGVDQLEPITEGGEASDTNEVPLVGDITPNMGYTLKLRSMYS
jgi:hypothetical protein